jgi:hypothetical protein
VTRKDRSGLLTQARPVAPRHTGSSRSEGHRAVHGARVDENESESLGEPLGDGALAGARGTIDGNDRTTTRAHDAND